VATADDPDRIRAKLWMARLNAAMPAFGEVRAICGFAAGRSNPTYLVEAQRGTYVLRKKPDGPLLPTAHQVEREARILQALEPTGFPAPRVLMVQTSPDHAIGTAWYAMTFARGRQTEDADLGLLQTAERRPAYLDMIQVLARLHRLDWVGLGLGDLRRPGGFVSRQVRRWARQLDQISPAPCDDLVQLARELESWTPEAADCLIHGDYRPGNLIFNSGAPRIEAVLDWELAAIGDAFCDLAHALLPFRMGSAEGGLADRPVDRLGLPDEEELIAAYVAAGGARPGADWPMYLAFASFRGAAIAHGVRVRAEAGQAAVSEIAPAERWAARLAGLGRSLMSKPLG
jgi:aminoglycoside phosphotransferase (APT) family kinase protein